MPARALPLRGRKVRPRTGLVRNQNHDRFGYPGAWESDERNAMRFDVQFKWFDMWVGAYWDRVGRMLYVCPLPCVVLRFWRRLP